MGIRGLLKTTVTTLVALFAFTGMAEAATVPVQSLTAPFMGSNPSVTKTPDGVHFGLYFNGGLPGGTLFYNGANGTTFGSLTALGYTYNYNTLDNDPRGAPFLRVFLDSDGDGLLDHDVIFDATLCGAASPPENTDIGVDVTTQTVRFDDDSCGQGSVQLPFATVQAAHAADTIVGILVTQGGPGGVNASAFLRNLTVNSDTFAFNVPPADGQPGAQGPQGAAGPAGPSTSTAPPLKCVGAKVRLFHAPRMRDEVFLRVRAGLMTARGFKPLKARRRIVRLNLRNKPAGNYNVRLISFYLTADKRIHRVISRRHFSVACS